jgi:hypothetical protein
MMSTEIADRFDSESGPVYESEHSDSLFVVVSRPNTFDDNNEVEVRRVEDGEWFGVYQDNFRKAYRKVADTLGEVDG